MSEPDLTQIPDSMIFDGLPTVTQYTGMGRSAVYQGIRDLGFPPPYQVGLRMVRWKRSEVLAWLSSRPRGLRTTPVDRARAAKKTRVTA